MRAEMALNRGQALNLEALEKRLTHELTAAVTRAAEGMRTPAELKPYLSPGFAGRLGIDPERPLTADEIGNLLNGVRREQIETCTPHSRWRSNGERLLFQP